VIETIPLDHILSWMVGFLFALSSRKAQKDFSTPFNKYFKRGLLYQIFVFFIIGLYLATFWPAWSWMYFINPEGKTGLTYLMVIYYILSYCLAFILAWFLIRKDLEKILYALFGILIIAFLLLTLIPLKRLMFVGGYEEFVDGFARSAFNYPEFFWSMVVIGIYFFIPLIILLRKTYKEAGV
jgi:hypothetical protein